jgi:hypothetical protein
LKGRAALQRVGWGGITWASKGGWGGVIGNDDETVVLAANTCFSVSPPGEQQGATAYGSEENAMGIFRGW